MVEIIPALLPKSFAELESGLERLKGVAPFVQIDLVGSNVLAGQESIPFWEEFDFEADIMLPTPSHDVEACVQAGASRVVVHAAAKDARAALQKLQATREGSFAVAVGVALGAHDTPEVLQEYEGLYDYVQVMGIEHIGKQGEPFAEQSIALVVALRATYADLSIQVDGAAATHPYELAQAGANRLVVGSAIMHADNPRAELERLYTIANKK